MIKSLLSKFLGLYFSMSTWLFIWRFQPIHLGHISAIRQLLESNLDHIVIGIGSSNTHSSQENPFSYDERKTLVQESISIHFPDQDFTIVAVPDQESDTEWVDYIMNSISPTVIMSGNPWIKDCFLEQEVKILEPLFDQKISATDIRQAWREERLDYVSLYLDSHVKRFLIGIK